MVLFPSVYFWIVFSGLVNRISIIPTMSHTIGMEVILIRMIFTVQHQWKFLNFNILRIRFSNKMVSLNKFTSNTNKNVLMVINSSLSSAIDLILLSRTCESRCWTIDGNEYPLSFLVILSPRKFQSSYVQRIQTIRCRRCQDGSSVKLP